MELSHQNAMKIVNEISHIIGQHVNMMDEKGYIIASTDPARIGTFHGGAATLLANNLQELTIDNDEQFAGSRKGINLPLLLNDQMAGVLGVTGEYREVMKYGQIIKKMTEAMMQENYQKEQKKIDDRIHSRFLDEWVLDGAPLTPDMVERGARLNIDVRQSYRVIVAVIAELRLYSDTPQGQVLIDRINRSVRRMMEQAGGIFTKTATKMICLVPRAGSDDELAAEKAREITRTVEQEFGVRLFAGIDGQAENVHQAYQQASKAVQGCSPGGKDICLYDDIGLEIFLEDIPPAQRLAFVRRVFRGYNEREMEYVVGLLQVYFETDGSLGKTAERLFLHKNTLQYKLKKVHERTGYDPRKLGDSALIYLAMQFYLADKAL